LTSAVVGHEEFALDWTSVAVGAVGVGAAVGAAIGAAGCDAVGWTSVAASGAGGVGVLVGVGVELLPRKKAPANKASAAKGKIHFTTFFMAFSF